RGPYVVAARGWAQPPRITPVRATLATSKKKRSPVRPPLPGTGRGLRALDPLAEQGLGALMATRTYPVFADIEGKLDVLRVECTKCPRKGRYSVHKLIEKYGRKGNMMKWKEQLNSDCPRRDAHSMHERCDLVCPDLPKVL